MQYYNIALLLVQVDRQVALCYVKVSHSHRTSLAIKVNFDYINRLNFNNCYDVFKKNVLHHQAITQ